MCVGKRDKKKKKKKELSISIQLSLSLVAQLGRQPSLSPSGRSICFCGGSLKPAVILALLWTSTTGTLKAPSPSAFWELPSFLWASIQMFTWRDWDLQTRASDGRQANWVYFPSCWDEHGGGTAASLHASFRLRRSFCSVRVTAQKTEEWTARERKLYFI